MGDMPHVSVHFATLCCFYSLFSTQTFQWVLTALEGRYAKRKSDSPVAQSVLAEFGGRCQKVRHRVRYTHACTQLHRIPVGLTRSGLSIYSHNLLLALMFIIVINLLSTCKYSQVDMGEFVHFLSFC